MKKTIKYDKTKRWWFYEDGTRANRIISKSDNLIYLLNSDGTQTKVRKIRYNGKDRYVVEPNYLRKPYKRSFILNVSNGIKNLFNGKKELGIMELNRAMHNPNFKITAGILGQFIPFAGNALILSGMQDKIDSKKYSSAFKGKGGYKYKQFISNPSDGSEYVKGINYGSTAIMNDLGLTNEEYKRIAKMAMNAYRAESGFGSRDWYNEVSKTYPVLSATSAEGHSLLARTNKAHAIFSKGYNPITISTWKGDFNYTPNKEGVNKSRALLLASGVGFGATRSKNVRSAIPKLFQDDPYNQTRSPLMLDGINTAYLIGKAYNHFKNTPIYFKDGTPMTIELKVGYFWNLGDVVRDKYGRTKLDKNSDTNYVSWFN